jgi:hypothetical protein
MATKVRPGEHDATPAGVRLVAFDSDTKMYREFSRAKDGANSRIRPKHRGEGVRLPVLAHDHGVEIASGERADKIVQKPGLLVRLGCRWQFLLQEQWELLR